MDVEQPATTLYRRPDQRKGVRELMGMDQSETTDQGTATEEPSNVEKTREAAPAGVKVGWVKGVFIPVTLNILGVIMFLRLSWYDRHHKCSREMLS